MTELRLVVPAGGGGRADRFAADLSGLSRSRVQRLISEGRVTADGQPVKANTVVAPGAVLVIDVPPVEPAGIEPEAIPLDVVFEDADVLVVDKPAGLVVHPSPGHWSGTLVNALLARDTAYGGIAGVERPGIVHRLDRDTSGLLMVAKNDAAQTSLMAQLKARRVKKTYLALVQGSVQAAAGRIEAPIGRDPKNRMRMAVVPDGRPSVTGLPGPGALRRLDPPRGRPRDRPDAPDPGPPRGPRAPGRRRPGLRHGDGAPRSRRPRAASSSTPGASSSRRRRPGDLVRAEAPLPAELEEVLARLRETAPGMPGRPAVAGGRPMTEQPLGAAPAPDDPLAGAPSAGAPGPCSSSSRGRPASARTRSSRRSDSGRATPTTTTSSPARPGPRAPARSTAPATTS